MGALYVSTSLSLNVEMDPRLGSCRALDLVSWRPYTLALASLYILRETPYSITVHGFRRDFLDALYVSTGPALHIETEPVLSLCLAPDIVSRASYTLVPGPAVAIEMDLMLAPCPAFDLVSSFLGHPIP